MHRLSWQVGGARRDPDRAADRALGRPTSAPSSPRSCLPRPGQPEPRSRHRRQCSPRGRPPREPRPPAPQPALQFNKKLIFAFSQRHRRDLSIALFVPLLRCPSLHPSGLLLFISPIAPSSTPPLSASPPASLLSASSLSSNLPSRLPFSRTLPVHLPGPLFPSHKQGSSTQPSSRPDRYQIMIKSISSGRMP